MSKKITGFFIQKGMIDIIHAYLRVSRKKQKEMRQDLLIAEYAEKNNFIVERWHIEKIGGQISFNQRPVYSQVIKELRIGDTLILSEIDRLGRSARETLDELRHLHSLKIKVIILDMPYLSDWNLMQDNQMYQMVFDIVVTVRAHLAEKEVKDIQNRIRGALKEAKIRGAILGRPTIDRIGLPKEFVDCYESYLKGNYGQITKTQLARMIGVSRGTLYNYIKYYQNTVK